MDPEKAHYRTMGVFGLGLGVPGVGGALRQSMIPEHNPVTLWKWLDFGFRTVWGWLRGLTRMVGSTSSRPWALPSWRWAP